MKNKNEVIRTYGCGKPKSNQIIQLLNLFHAEKLVIEISNIGKNSVFSKSIQEKKNVLFTETAGKWMSIVMFGHFDGNFANLLDEIIDDNPGDISLYLTDLSLEEVLSYCYTWAVRKVRTKYSFCKCDFAIMLDESAFMIHYDAKVFEQSYIMLKMNEIFKNMDVLNLIKRKEPFRQNGDSWWQKFRQKLFNNKNEVTRTYGYGKPRSNDIIQLLKLFHAEKLVIEISDVSMNSTFGKGIQEKKNVLFTETAGKWMSIVMFGHFDGNFANLLDEIIDDNPGDISLYLTDLSLEEVLSYCYTWAVRKVRTKYSFCKCDFAIMLDESVFMIHYDSEEFKQSDLILKIDEIFKNSNMLDSLERKH
ncbi:MAG: hypothetical protein NC345_12035 [Lachnospira sp.]|nr:hypothetical protein [Lachnospira sp.]